jgi:uncharacterized delta-60 repeat protein
MRVSHWLRLLTVRRNRPRPQRATPRRAFRPCIERLEDRTTPSAGLLDPTFGAGGTVLSNTGMGVQKLTNITLQPDGKLLASGWVGASQQQSSFAAVRYNADGSPDTSFGNGGLATVNFNGLSGPPINFEGAMAIAVQPGSGGKILLAGSVWTSKGPEFGVVRLNPNGTLDTTFGAKGSGGKVTVSPGLGTGEDSDMAVLPDGRFILAGMSGPITLARFNANGTLDTTFGNKGVVVSSDSVNSQGIDFHAVRVALDASGRIVVSGTAPGTLREFLVARFNANGSPDTTFGAAHTGVVTTDIPGSVAPGDNAYALALQGDGKIVVGGQAVIGNWGLLTLVRYNPDGSLDTTFNGDGMVTAAPVPGGNISGGEVDALAIQPDGEIVAAGQGGYVVTQSDGSTYQSPNQIVSMRFHADGSLDTSYGPLGTGAVMTSLGFNSQRPWGMVLQPNGRVVVESTMNTDEPSVSNPSPYLEYFALVGLTGSAPAPSPVQVSSFTASATTVAAGSSVSLTAGSITTTNAGATITQVAFYAVDFTGTKQLLGYGTLNADGTWSLTFTPKRSGSYTLLALAVDSTGAISDPASLGLNVV